MPVDTRAGGKETDKAAARALALFNRAQFVRSVVDQAGLPQDSLAEVCFAGRSNAGKSSAINALVNHNRLAFSGKAPGRTRELNFFALGKGRYLVDLPGYGYACAGRTLRANWDKLIGSYLLKRAQLKAVVLIMDIRRAPTPLDVQLIDFLRPAARPVFALLTKADKLARGARLRALREIERTLAQHSVHSVQLFSSLTGDGVAAARTRLHELIELGCELPLKSQPAGQCPREQKAPGEGE